VTGPGFGQTSLFPPEPAPDPLLCWLWLANTLGAGSSHAGRVLDVFGGAQEAWENRDSDAFRKAVGSPAFARANLPDNTPAHYRAFARRCAARNIRILPYDDPDYPLAFSRIPDMPLVLYCTGDPLWLNEPGAVGMVGSRRPTEYGLQAAADLGSGLAKNGAIIVSGLADGLDSAGHRAAVKENCPTIGVLGVPIDRTYPASNRELRKKIEQKGCVDQRVPARERPRWPQWLFAAQPAHCGAVLGAGGGGSAGKERHHVHSQPCRAVWQAGVRGAGQHLLAQLGGHQRPAAGGPGQSRLQTRRPVRGAGPAGCGGSGGGALCA